MTLAASVSLAYVAGDSIELEFAVSDEAGETANLAGDTVRFAVVGRGETVISTESDPPTATAEITNPAGGVFTVSIPPQSTQPLLGTYRWQAELEDLSGNVETVARGFITFVRNLLEVAS